MKANDLRRGVVILHNNIPHRVMEFHHHTPGNLRAKVQTKLRNLLNGSQTEIRYSSTEDVPEADVSTLPATYLYADNSGFHFLYSESYEEVTISSELLGDGKYFLQEQMAVQITTFNDNPIGVEMPQTVTLTVVETEPELRGATASNSPKPAKTDTGLVVSVPAFVKVGDRIVVNTVESKYLSRAD